MKKVLVVDDEKLIVKGLKFSLEQDDMEVDVAYDGGEAFEKIKNNSYDIVREMSLRLPFGYGSDSVSFPMSRS